MTERKNCDNGKEGIGKKETLIEGNKVQDQDDEGRAKRGNNEKEASRMKQTNKEREKDHAEQKNGSEQKSGSEKQKQGNNEIYGRETNWAVKGKSEEAVRRGEEKSEAREQRGERKAITGNVDVEGLGGGEKETRGKGQKKEGSKEKDGEEKGGKKWAGRGGKDEKREEVNRYLGTRERNPIDDERARENIPETKQNGGNGGGGGAEGGGEDICGHEGNKETDSNKCGVVGKEESAMAFNEKGGKKINDGSLAVGNVLFGREWLRSGENKEEDQEKGVGIEGVGGRVGGEVEDGKSQEKMELERLTVEESNLERKVSWLILDEEKREHRENVEGEFIRRSTATGSL